MIPPQEKVLVAMSGGINSSTTAVLLKTQGYDVAGVFFQLRGPTTEEFQSQCCRTLDQQGKGRLKTICNDIGIPLHVIQAESLFEDKVIDYTIHECLQNHIPNPCASCNSEVKFKLLLEKADALGCQWIATGHYAQISRDSGSGTAHLLKAVDATRDQTYFMFSLNQNVLQRLLIPLGSLTGLMVDRIAEKFDFKLSAIENKRTTCFIDEPGTQAFIESRVPVSMRIPGMVRNFEGMVVGEHTGLFQYRLGAPSFLSNPDQATTPLYIIGFAPTSQSLIIDNDKSLFQKELKAIKTNWVRPMDGLRGFRCLAKLGAGDTEHPCWVTCFENQRVHVEFDETLRAISKGTAIVFYKDDEVLGGAYVEIFGTKE